MRLLALGLVLLSSRAFASEPDRPDSTYSSVILANDSALARVVESIARAITTTASDGYVVSERFVSDVATTKGNELATLLAKRLAARLGTHYRAHPGTSTFEEAWASSGSYCHVIQLRPELMRSELRVQASVYGVGATTQKPWTLVTQTSARAAIDAEIRAYLPPLQEKIPTRKDLPFPDGSDTVSAACGDLDNDGELELAIVGRRRVRLLRWTKDQIQLQNSRAMSELSSVYPLPLREPIGFGVFASEIDRLGNIETFLYVSTTDRTMSVGLDSALGVRQRFPALALPRGAHVACLHRRAGLLSGTIMPCDRTMTPFAAPLPGEFDAYASSALIMPNGEALITSGGRRPSGVVDVWDTKGRMTKIEPNPRSGSAATQNDGPGAQLALADLDQNGAIDILTSRDVRDANEDALVVYEWNAIGTESPKERFRIPFSHGIRAITTCPSLSDLPNAVVVITNDEVSFVQ